MICRCNDGQLLIEVCAGCHIISDVEHAGACGVQAICTHIVLWWGAHVLSHDVRPWRDADCLGASLNGLVIITAHCSCDLLTSWWHLQMGPQRQLHHPWHLIAHCNANLCCLMVFERERAPQAARQGHTWLGGPFTDSLTNFCWTSHCWATALSICCKVAVSATSTKLGEPPWPPII